MSTVDSILYATEIVSVIQCWPLSFASLCSVADPESFDTDPDPTFHANADTDPIFLSYERKKKKFFKIFNYCFQNSTKLVMCNFLSKNAGGGVRSDE